MMTLELPDWVVCPLCKGELGRASIPPDMKLECTACHHVFESRKGLPILLDEEGLKACHEDIEHHGAVTPVYHNARHRSPCTMEYLDYWCSQQLGMLPQRQYGRVVELMAGGSELSRRAADLPKPIVALDINYELLALSREELLPHIVPICGSAFRLPFKDASIDLILIQGGLHHVRHNVVAALKEMSRCLAPGGVLMASEPRNDNPLLHGFRRIFYTMHPHHEQEVEDGFTRAQMQSALEQAGLKLEAYEPFAYLGYMLIGNTDLIAVFRGMRRNWFSRSLIKLDRAWSKMKGLRGLAWASFVRAAKPA